MNRLTLFGTKSELQSATWSPGQRSLADMSARLNRAALVRQSRRDESEKRTVNHSTGRPFVSFITLSITQPGYHGSGFDSMSFVPRAMTTAVVLFVSLFFTVVAPAEAVLPTRASMLTSGHTPVAVMREANDPNASAPTVSESPTNRSVPWPLFDPLAGNCPVRACAAVPPNVAAHNSAHGTTQRARR